MLSKIHWARLTPIVMLLVLTLLATMSLTPLHNVREDTGTRHAGVEVRENGAIALTPPPPFIISALAQTASSNKIITLVSWVETRETINLENALSQLERKGYAIVLLDLSEGFLEVQKRLYPLPRFDCSSWWTGKPHIIITVRVYGNGTIIAYTPPIDISSSNEKSYLKTYLGLLAYYDKNMNAPNLVTWFIVKEVLETLGLSQYVGDIKSGIPQYPDAKYIVFIWSDDDWSEDKISGVYRVSEGVDVIGAVLLLVITSWGDRAEVKLEINGQELIDLITGVYVCNYDVVDLHRQDNDFFKPGVEYYLKVYDIYKYNKDKFFFVIVAVLG